MITRYSGGLVIEVKDGTLVASWHKGYTNMNVGKLNKQGEMQLVECENGIEVRGTRAVEELYADGYKNVCEVERPSETAIESWEEFGDCFVQVWAEPESEQ